MQLTLFQRSVPSSCPFPPLSLQIFQETTASLDSENRHFDSAADAAKAAAAAQHSGRSHKHAEAIESSSSASATKSKTSSSDGRTRQQKQQQQQQQQQLQKHTVAVVENESTGPNYSVIFRLVSPMNAFHWHSALFEIYHFLAVCFVFRVTFAKQRDNLLHDSCISVLFIQVA